MNRFEEVPLNFAKRNENVFVCAVCCRKLLMREISGKLIPKGAKFRVKTQPALSLHAFECRS